MDLNIIEVFVECDCGFGILSKGPKIEIECPECGAIYQREGVRVSQIRPSIRLVQQEGSKQQEGDPDGTDI